jgi:hypothetical protein
LDFDSAMFSPNQADVRRFFCAAYRKHREQAPMDALETLAAQWIQEHPEYHDLLADEARALAHTGEQDPHNPFLHLSMHLSVSEQCSIDQPPGIRGAVERLTQRRDDLHSAHHEVMECLGAMLWESQRSGQAPDGQAYIDAVARLATRH